MKTDKLSREVRCYEQVTTEQLTNLAGSEMMGRKVPSNRAQRMVLELRKLTVCSRKQNVLRFLQNRPGKFACTRQDANFRLAYLGSRTGTARHCKKAWENAQS